ncbi:glycoside hydrolase family 3 C-terminal domain-containing protein [Actinacidiphila oryziradicis]
MTTDHLPFRVEAQPVSQRVDDLLARLTLDERIAMLHQFAPAVPRLGLAAFRTGQEALHGVAWMGPATVFPQAVGLGATWNEDLVRRVGEAVGTEVRAMRKWNERVGLNVWAPTVNLLRDPRWGRNEEGYSEDPRLTASIATAYTRGLRGDHPTYWRTAPVLKHWLAHNNETERDTTSSSVRPRVLREYDLEAFRGPIEAGTAIGVMPAYNLVNGRPNHVSPLLREQLRAWTDQELVVCSDAGAPSNLVNSEHYYDTHEEATAAALRAGVDSFTDHDQDSSQIIARLHGALDRGLIDESDIDTAVRRLLTMRFLLGEFDPDQDPYAGIGEESFDTPGHRALAQESAEQAVVLLKNDGLLPLADDGENTVAVVGLLADDLKLDWYSGSFIRRTTLREALVERLGADRVIYAEGSDTVRLRAADGSWVQVPESAVAEQQDEGSFNPANATGRTDLPPVTTGDTPTDLALIDWGGGALTLRAIEKEREALPQKGGGGRRVGGLYLTVAGDGYVRAAADRPGGWIVQETFTLESHGESHLLKHTGSGQYISVAADGLKVAAQGTPFSVEVVRRGEDAVAEAARRAGTVIVVAGNDAHINGRETEDRTTLALPPHQDRLWRAAHAANPRTALVLSAAYPYAVPEADDRLPALLWTAHGGQAGGTALARVLYGAVSPAGRLPQTWYASDADLPNQLLDYDIISAGATYLYFRGTPLYPFGHGLSYASFSYRDLTLTQDPDAATLIASFTITNTGDVAADEVVQLYTRESDPRVTRPGRQLAAYRRLRLDPGLSETVTFTLPLHVLGFWDVAHGHWTVDPGTYEILAGASSTDIRLTATLKLDGEPPAPRPVLVRGLEAADFDAQTATTLVDRTKVRGDAVASGADTPGRLVFRTCDFGARDTAGTSTGSASVILDAARAEPGEATVELHLGDGTHLATARVPSTGGPYAYTAVRVAVPELPDGVHDLHITLRGALRLARLSFSG